MKSARRLPGWHAWGTLSRQQLPPELWPWLTEPGSLTERLKQKAGKTLAVHVHTHGWQQARIDEQRYLALPKRDRVMVREVTLSGHGKPWIVARSLFPASALRGKGQKLRNLGERFLGEALYTDRQLIRSKPQIALLRPWHRDYQRAIQTLNHSPALLWARRCVIFFHRQPILVSEIFLPAIWQ